MLIVVSSSFFSGGLVLDFASVAGCPERCGTRESIHVPVGLLDMKDHLSIFPPKRRDPQMCTFGFSRCRVKPRSQWKGVWRRGSAEEVCGSRGGGSSRWSPGTGDLAESRAGWSVRTGVTNIQTKPSHTTCPKPSFFSKKKKQMLFQNFKSNSFKNLKIKFLKFF